MRGTRGAPGPPPGRWRAALLLALAAGSVLIGPGGLHGQRADPRDEARLLREAATRESRGDLEGAEASLRELLKNAPSSAGGLFALERVLRARGRLVGILPVADAYLASDPDAAGARYLKLRVLAELDSIQALEAGAEAWIRTRPATPEPYREVARLFDEVFGPERALAVLRRGAAALKDPAALAPELGDLLVRMDRPREAVEAWSRGIGAGGEGGQQVLRRLRQLPGDRIALGGALVEALTAAPTTPARRRVAVEAAMDAGLLDRARSLAEGVAGDLPAEERRGFLEDAARWAESAGDPRLRLWAYARLREGSAEGPPSRTLDLRIAEVALTVGDTAAALEAQARLARGLPPGSPERRRVVAEMIRLEAPRSDAASLRRRLEGFRGEFPEAPEIDALAAQVAAALQARGRDEEAAEVLEGVSGPRSALERAYLLLEGGDVPLGRQALLESVAGLPPSVATDVIQLASLLDRLDPPAAQAVARAAAEAHRGRGAEAAATLASAAADVPEADRPGLLAHAARLAEAAGDGEGAARLRTALLERHGDAPETAEAALSLARWHAERGDPDALREAVRLLEDLILSRPASPVVPAARRELQRVRTRLP